jgi:predicted RecA/RadA family phage recombinase
MQNYVQKGDVVTMPAPYDVLSGGGAQVGQLFGVAGCDALSGADVDLKTTGVFDLPKAASQAWTVGALIFWDNTNKVCTTVSTSNLQLGCALVAVGSGAGEIVGRVRLNGIARAAGA